MADKSKKKEDILEWVELSDYDLKTAEAMQYRDALPGRNEGVGQKSNRKIIRTISQGN
ncbi:MAG: hypothetical protein HZB36_03740 [Candidatus Omnitrophica bacterium]|nr:hypothetical protein [Candidatus Omnitrophota bacterium]